MTPVAPPPPNGTANTRFNGLKILLIVSLGLNLLFVGGGIARFISHGPPERMSGISQMQLIPRKFLGELDRGRRAELMKVFKEFAPAFREGRKAVREEAVKMAAALDAEPYDAASVKAAIEAYSGRSSALASDGGKAALALIDRLSADERKLLARHIRLRDEGGRKKPQAGGQD